MSNDMSPTLCQLIEWAREYVRENPPTPEVMEEQRRSFAYGNVAIHNPNVTREMVDRVADEMAEERKNAKEIQ